MSDNQEWLGLMIGNSRLHFAIFTGARLEKTWDIDHIQTEEKAIEEILKNILENQGIKLNNEMSLVIASVVPQQTKLWQTYPQAEVITIERLPLPGVYPTLGIDRALAVWGAGTELGWPVLVIDTGTAITFTGADRQQKLVGGAILPGLRLQLSALATETAMLPWIDLPVELPHRWAKQTATAIQSGVIYMVLAGMENYIEAWQEEFPQSQVVLTGGDRSLLLTHLRTMFPELAANIIDAPDVIFWGMRKYWLRQK